MHGVTLVNGVTLVHVVTLVHGVTLVNGVTLVHGVTLVVHCYTRAWHYTCALIDTALVHVIYTRA